LLSLLGAENCLIENGEQPPSAVLLQARAPALHLNLFYAPRNISLWFTPKYLKGEKARYYRAGKVRLRTLRISISAGFLGAWKNDVAL
jgi:hypothetical protein